MNKNDKLNHLLTSNKLESIQTTDKFVAKKDKFHEFIDIRDDEKCIRCLVCVQQCAFEVNYFNTVDFKIESDDSECVGCHRCETRALVRTFAFENEIAQIAEHRN